MVNDNSTSNDASDDAESMANPSPPEAATAPLEGEVIDAHSASNTDGPGNEHAPGAGGEADAASVTSLRTQLDNALAEVQAQKEQALRAIAEADNVRKRAQRDQENARKFALERFVNELLPVKDSLELGLAAASDEVNLADLKEGTQLTLRMFGAAIEKFGVQEIAPVAGEAFDPERHQAMTMRESDQHASGTVLDVVQKGYSLNDRLVRPAMVVVVQ